MIALQSITTSLAKDRMR